MLNSNKIKLDFPIFKNHPKLVYLDSASTTQTPQPVLDAMDEYYKTYHANIHRGIYDLSLKASKAFEASRASLASFINAKSEEIIFTSGTTAALNQLAYSIGPRLSHRDNIVLTRYEHHANLVPWQQMAKHYGFEIRFIELINPPSRGVTGGVSPSASPIRSTVTNDRHAKGLHPPYAPLEGGIDLDNASQIIDTNTKIVSFGLVSNVLGTIAPAQEIIKLTKQVRAVTIVDAAQAAAHIPIDVRALDCDFLAFSGHKMYGPTGIGVLYGKKEMLEEHLEPFLFGGDMVREVTYTNATWNDIPYRFEAGTPNIAGAIGLGKAVEFITSLSQFPSPRGRGTEGEGNHWDVIRQHEKSLTNKLINQLTNIGARIIGSATTNPPSRGVAGGVSPLRGGLSSYQLATQEALHPPYAPLEGGFDRIGVVSFTIPGIHPHDIAEILNQENICVRAGHHCAMPLHQHLGLTATVRASIGVYNTEENIEKLIKGIKKVKKIFK